LLEVFFTQHGITGVCALERGRRAQHLHIQSAFKCGLAADRRSLAACRVALRAFVPFTALDGVVITLKVSGEQQSWPYMIGYCLKDNHMAHFSVKAVGVTAEQLEEGKEAYNNICDEHAKGKFGLNKKGSAKYASSDFQIFRFLHKTR
jgi:hypothetical protein